MQVSQTASEGLKREYKVVFDAAEIEQRLSGRFDELKRSVQLPGFRAGKVPLSLLRKRFGKSVMSEVLEEVLKAGTEEALSRESSRPASQPQVKVTQFDDGTDLEYEIEVEVLPEIELADFSSIEVERLKIDPTEEDLEARLQEFVARQRTFESAAEGQAARTGDLVVLDYQGTVDGEPIEGGAATDHSIELGAGRLVPGFEDQLVGAGAGDHVVVKVTFPEDYTTKKLAGAAASFEVDVKEVREARVPEANDEFAKGLGLEDLDKLRAVLRDQLEREYATLGRARAKRSLLDTLAGSYDFQLPPGLVESEFETIWNRVEHDRSHGHADPEFQDKTDEVLKPEIRSIAERRVRLGLLLSEVGQRNNITVGEDELGRAIADQARRMPGQERSTYEFFEKNPEAVEQLRAPLFEDKVVDFVLEMANVSERTVSFQTFADEDAAADEAEAAEGDAPKSSEPKASKPQTSESG
jgi:trigger factor